MYTYIGCIIEGLGPGGGLRNFKFLLMSLSHTMYKIVTPHLPVETNTFYCPLKKIDINCYIQILDQKYQNLCREHYTSLLKTWKCTKFPCHFKHVKRQHKQIWLLLSNILAELYVLHCIEMRYFRSTL